MSNPPIFLRSSQNDEKLPIRMSLEVEIEIEAQLRGCRKSPLNWSTSILTNFKWLWGRFFALLHICIKYMNYQTQTNIVASNQVTTKSAKG